MVRMNCPAPVVSRLYHSTCGSSCSEPRITRACRFVSARGSLCHRTGVVVRRTDIAELHYICHIDNLRSIFARGILCRRDIVDRESAGEVEFTSVADPRIVQRRSERTIPGGLSLDQYVNLFFNARNSMLYRVIKNYDTSRRVPRDHIAILRVSTKILDTQGVIVTDINAAIGPQPRWYSVEEGIPRLDKDEIFAEFWTETPGHEARMMAEVLVPARVASSYLLGAYACSTESAATIKEIAMASGKSLPVAVSPSMFFMGGST